MMRKIYLYTILATLLSFVGNSCVSLDQNPDQILTNDQVYSDPKLIKSVLANFYERISWGQHVQDLYDYTRVDEAIRFDHDDVRNFDRNRWREYNYELVRNLNQFLEGLEGTTVLTAEEKKPLASEARFIRAWYYFCSGRGLGGVPIVGDKVYEYIPGMDITTIQEPRSTEAALYDYIISECQAISEEGMLSAEKNDNSARANRWTAKMLEARAALYAASIAKYGVSTPTVVTPGKEVSIDATKAQAYFTIALEAAEYVMDNSPYVLQDRKADDKAKNFYEAVCIKDGNTEVIWGRDYKYPGQTHHFTKDCLPATMAEDGNSSYLSVLLNLVEEYELINTTTPGQGSKFNTGTIDNPVFYPTADALFKERDPRLGGTVLYPGSTFRGEEIVLQVGQLNIENSKWVKKEGQIGAKDDNGKLITSLNGPIYNSALHLVNKTGFTIRKFLDETTGSGTTGRGSEMWNPRFRMAEAYMIAAEASLELNGGSNAKTLKYINAVRLRAGVKELTTVTFDNIVHERRVEFAFEDHRYWDMKRWRLAHKTWTGNQNDTSAKRRGLWPYYVVSQGNANDGKWYFEERDMSFIYPNALKFETKNYYSEMDNAWLNKNPKLVKNPEQ